MLGRIIALIIILSVGLIAAWSALSILFPPFIFIHSEYGTGPFESYGPYTTFATSSSIGSVGLVELVTVLMAIALLALVVGFLVVALRKSRASGSGREHPGERFDAGYGQSDTQLIQDLHRIATRLEARVETLETIMLERPSVTTGR